MKFYAGFLIAVSWGMVVAVFALPPAHAQGTPPTKGLFAEESTRVDGALVRRVRDREDGVICYVVTGAQAIGDPYHGIRDSIGRHVAVSCVQEHVNQ